MNASTRQSGFTLIEVMVAASLVVAFALAFATSFGVAFGSTRDNLLRQQATGVANEEFEYVRALTWPELAMTAVSTAAPMLDDSRQRLVGSEAGTGSDETLAVIPHSGVVTPWRTYTVDGQEYLVWRYVTHTADGLRRFVALVQWSHQGASESLLSSTLISEVTARANLPGGVVTTAPGVLATSTTTTTVAPTTTTTTSTLTSPTTTTTTTTTTVPAATPLSVTEFTITLIRSVGKQTAALTVVDNNLQSVSGAIAYGIWSTAPAEDGYPLSVQQTTNGSGRVTFVHNDGHATGTVVQFCVTAVVKTGYSYVGGTQCVAATW